MTRAAMCVVILCIFIAGLVTAASRNAMGGAFVGRVMTCCYWFVTLLGGVYFSTAIVEEKEEQTLPLLRMTGAPPSAILLGKSIPRLAFVLSFLIVVLPFVFLSVTLGGVLFRGMLTAALGVLCYSVMMSQLGLFCSVIARDSQRAFSMTLVIWIALEFFPSWCSLFSHAFMAWGELKNTAAAKATLLTTDPGLWFNRAAAQAHLIFLDLGGLTDEWVLAKNLSFYFGGFSTNAIWRPQMSCHLILAVVFFLLSRLCFERFTAAAAAGIAKDSRRKVRLFVPRPASSWPLAWKSWQHIGGGWLWFFLRLIGAPLILLSIIYGIAYAVDEKVDGTMLSVTFTMAGTVISIAHVAILFGRLFNNEVKEKTLSSILMMPVSAHSIVIQSMLGLLPAIFASSSCLMVGIVLLIAGDRPGGADSPLESIWFYQMFAWGITSLYLGVRLSIRLTYGGMLLAIIGCWIGGVFFLVMLAEMCRAIGGLQFQNDMMEYVIPLGLFVVEPPIWLICHVGIVKSLRKAAAQ